MASREDIYYKETMGCVQSLWVKYKHAEVEGKTIGTASPLKFNGIEEPAVVSTKGCTKKLRSRKCRHCGIQGHNKRKCPQLDVAKDMDSAACESPYSQFSLMPFSPHEVSFNLNSTPPIIEDEDIGINLDRSSPSPEEASGSHMQPPSVNGLLHYMPSLYEEGEPSMVILSYL